MDIYMTVLLLIRLTLYAAPIRWTISRVEPLSNAASEAKSTVSSVIIDSLTNIHTVKAGTRTGRDQLCQTKPDHIAQTRIGTIYHNDQNGIGCIRLTVCFCLQRSVGDSFMTSVVSRRGNDRCHDFDFAHRNDQ